ncbi:MAG: peptidase T [Breznakibacter sp.]
MKRVLEKFLRYVAIDTKADTESLVTPSSPGQLEFGNLLFRELTQLGLSDVSMDSNGYLTATLPSNVKHHVPVVGFVAHMDTSPDFSGKDVKPQIVEKYKGGNIVLNHALNIILRPDEFPELNQYIGCDIVTTDGTTLLGADDKAGVAEIMTALAYLVDHPEIEHGRIRICFTPDEEIGQGADHFDVPGFGADFAYTIDGGQIGELEFENFNAAMAKIIINGRNVHPGYAKNKMRNALLMANRLIGMLPKTQVPELTEGYEGFFHLNSMKGDVERAELFYLIRDFDPGNFEERKKLMVGLIEELNKEFGSGAIELELKDQYANMREKIEPVMHVVDFAKQAMVEAGVIPIVRPIRGGTDGARLSYMGLPTPNIFAGGHNFHGRYEFVPVQSMEKAVEVIVNIAKQVAGSN